MNSISYPTGAVYTFTKRDTTDNFGTDGIRKYQTYYMATLRNEYFNDETNKLSRFNVSQETIVHDNSIKEETSLEIPLTTASGYPYYRNVSEIPSDIKYVVGIEKVDVNKEGEKNLTTNSYTY